MQLIFQELTQGMLRSMRRPVALLALGFTVFACQSRPREGAASSSSLKTQADPGVVGTK